MHIGGTQNKYSHLEDQNNKGSEHINVALEENTVNNVNWK
jgi:hypothetical protein